MANLPYVMTLTKFYKIIRGSNSCHCCVLFRLLLKDKNVRCIWKLVVLCQLWIVSSLKYTLFVYQIHEHYIFSKIFKCNDKTIDCKLHGYDIFVWYKRIIANIYDVMQSHSSSVIVLILFSHLETSILHYTSFTYNSIHLC